MAATSHLEGDYSTRRVFGFACNQAFIFFLFYMGPNRGYQLGGALFERFDLLFILLFMVIGLAILRSHSKRSRKLLLQRPLLYVYAVLMAAASLLFASGPETAAWQPVEGAFIGLGTAFLLVAWGRSFGRVPTDTSVTEVFAGSLTGALICFAFSFVDNSQVLLALRALPIISVVLIDVPTGDEERRRAHLDDEGSGTAVVLSAKVMAGTLLFGVAAGLMETFNTEPGAPAISYLTVSMLLFGAFLMGVISLLATDGFGKGAPLSYAYRVAVFIMILGFIAVPLTQAISSPLPGEALVLSGYLGLETVLICLFLVLAQITGVDAAVSFSLGFVSLFGGELIGVVCANFADFAEVNLVTPYIVVVIAGALVLFSYVFLFTERDFSSLTEIVTTRNAFDDACTSISADYKLSKREAEILPYALRGRTSERIAQELSISRSTVDTHLRRIYAKVGVHSRQELIDLGEKVSKGSS